MQETLARIDEMVKKYPIMLFMKGSPQLPQCGFSARTTDALKQLAMPFAWCNVIADSQVRQSLPSYQDWPTFPQLYVNGELVGGCDIVLQMHQDGSLKKLLEDAAVNFPNEE